MGAPAPLPRPFAGRPFATADAISAGVPANRLRAGDLVTPYRGIRLPRTWTPSVWTKCAAYATRMPDAHAFSGPTAALLWGIPLPFELERDERLHVTALDDGRAPRGRGIAGHRAAGAAVERRLLRGIPVVAPVDAWLGLATLMSLDSLIAAGDRVLGLPEPLASRRELDDGLRRHRGKRGAKLLRAAAEEIRGNVYSPRETRTRLMVVRAGICADEPEPNGTIVLHNGRRVRGDLVFRRERVLVEYEGEHHRTDSRQWSLDLERYNDLALSGWLVLRIARGMSDREVLARITLALRSRA